MSEASDSGHNYVPQICCASGYIRSKTPGIVTSMSDLLSKVLSHRGEAEVLGPDWLREAVRDQAESLLTTAEPEPARS